MVRKKRIEVDLYTRGDGTVVSGHKKMVNVAEDNDITPENGKVGDKDHLLSIADSVLVEAGSDPEADIVLFSLGPGTGKWAARGFKGDRRWKTWAFAGVTPEEADPSEDPPYIGALYDFKVDERDWRLGHRVSMTATEAYSLVGDPLYKFLRKPEYGLTLKDFPTYLRSNFSLLLAYGPSFRGDTDYADVEQWDVSHVTCMQGMFFDNGDANPNISSWDTGKVRTMEGMFYKAKSFDQNLGDWDVSNVWNMDRIFEGSGMSPENLSATLVGWAKQGGFPDIPYKTKWKRILFAVTGARPKPEGLQTFVRFGPLPFEWKNLTSEGRAAAQYLIDNFYWRTW